MRCRKPLWESQKKKFIDYVYQTACDSPLPIPEIEASMNLIQLTLYILKDELKSINEPRLKYERLYSIIEGLNVNLKDFNVRAVSE